MMYYRDACVWRFMYTLSLVLALDLVSFRNQLSVQIAQSLSDQTMVSDFHLLGSTLCSIVSDIVSGPVLSRREKWRLGICKVSAKRQALSRVLLTQCHGA